MNLIIYLSGLIFNFSNTPKHYIFPSSNNKPSSLILPNSNIFTDYKKNGKDYLNNGYDERYYYRVYDEPDGGIIIDNIQIAYVKLKLLHLLENNDVDVLIKIEAINDYNFIHKKSQLSTNIMSGGLMDEWNFELEP